MKAIIFRYFNVVGANENIGDHLDSGHVIQKLCKAAMTGEQFKVFGGKGEDDDLAIAFGWNLIVLQADKSVAAFAESIQKNVPQYGFKKEGDRIYRVVNNNVVKGNVHRNKSAIFK